MTNFTTATPTTTTNLFNLSLSHTNQDQVNSFPKWAKALILVLWLIVSMTVIAGTVSVYQSNQTISKLEVAKSIQVTATEYQGSYQAQNLDAQHQAKINQQLTQAQDKKTKAEGTMVLALWITSIITATLVVIHKVFKNID